MLALYELQNYLIFLSHLPVLESIKSIPRKIIHTPSINPSFSALDEDIQNTTKEKVANEIPIKISTQFPVIQGVTWEETADE